MQMHYVNSGAGLPGCPGKKAIKQM